MYHPRVVASPQLSPVKGEDEVEPIEVMLLPFPHHPDYNL